MSYEQQNGVEETKGSDAEEEEEEPDGALNIHGVQDDDEVDLIVDHDTELHEDVAIAPDTDVEDALDEEEIANGGLDDATAILPVEEIDSDDESLNHSEFTKVDITKETVGVGGEYSDDESSDSDDSQEDFDTKIDNTYKVNFIKKHHAQEVYEDYQEIMSLVKVERDENGVITDSKHTTTPIMTKYERTRILGLRISQLNRGASRLIVTKNKIIDNNIIAESELKRKLLPFIISRPLPNGEKEHWRIQDLEII